MPRISGGRERLMVIFEGWYVPVFGMQSHLKIKSVQNLLDCQRHPMTNVTFSGNLHEGHGVDVYQAGLMWNSSDSKLNEMIRGRITGWVETEAEDHSVSSHGHLSLDARLVWDVQKRSVPLRVCNGGWLALVVSIEDELLERVRQLEERILRGESGEFIELRGYVAGMLVRDFL